MTILRKTFLPPIADLLAFEAAARHASISRAAQELHLTQSAVSRQIRQLEQQLGMALFHRVRQRIVLTDAGRVYAADVTLWHCCVRFAVILSSRDTREPVAGVRPE